MVTVRKGELIHAVCCWTTQSSPPQMFFLYLEFHSDVHCRTFRYIDDFAGVSFFHVQYDII
jgi:hypothetical protein